MFYESLYFVNILSFDLFECVIFFVKKKEAAELAKRLEAQRVEDERRKAEEEKRANDMVLVMGRTTFCKKMLPRIFLFPSFY